MHHHNMQTLPTEGGPQKPSSRPSEGDLCTIVQMNFREFFHALG
jgi:hypothetical protein